MTPIEIFLRDNAAVTLVADLRHEMGDGMVIKS